MKLDREAGQERKLTLTASYENRRGESSSVSQRVTFPSGVEEFYDNTGIHKAVILARYTELMRNWSVDQRKAAKTDGDITAHADRRGGIPVCPRERVSALGRWEQAPVPLKVTGPYPELFQAFHDYLSAEMAAVRDETLSQELAVLARLGAWKPAAAAAEPERTVPDGGNKAPGSGSRKGSDPSGSSIKFKGFVEPDRTKRPGG